MRLTHAGDPFAEEVARAAVGDVAEVVRTHISPTSLDALILFGGYGKGEGAVRRTSGSPRLANNLDFLLLTRAVSTDDRDELRTALEEPLAQVGRAHDVGVDVSVIDGGALDRSRPKVMWYDLRFGHRVIIGPPERVRSLTRFRMDAIPASDVRHLMVNRGALLLLNEVILERDSLDAPTRRAVARHAAKAVLGHGDALLFARGAYHWSYREKRRRMAARCDVPAAFRELYDDAMGRRFDGGAGRLPDAPRPWNQALIASLSRPHLDFETWRIGTTLSEWSAYAEAAFGEALTEDGSSLRRWGAKLRSGLRSDAPPLRSPRARLGYRAADPRTTLDLLFPLVAYDAGDDARRLAAHSLRCPPGGRELRRAWLRSWGEHVDPSLDQVCKRLGVSLEGHQ